VAAQPPAAVTWGHIGGLGGEGVEMAGVRLAHAAALQEFACKLHPDARRRAPRRVQSLPQVVSPVAAATVSGSIDPVTITGFARPSTAKQSAAAV
jgi:hypothetical protein